MRCMYCREEVGEDGEVINDGKDRLHLDCMTRMLVGSVGHQNKTCSCYGGHDEDPPGLTAREAATAAAKLHKGEKYGS